MSAQRWDMLAPLLRRSIEMQPHANFGVRQCGCETLRTTGDLRLCQYHDGFQDALDASQVAHPVGPGLIVGSKADETRSGSSPDVATSEFDEPHKFYAAEGAS